MRPVLIPSLHGARKAALADNRDAPIQAGFALLSERMLLCAVNHGKVGTLVEPAYAIMVHKSQGSEYRHVALVLPPEPVQSVCQEWLYTAVTRARESLTLCGQEAVLRHAWTTPSPASPAWP